MVDITRLGSGSFVLRKETFEERKTAWKIRAKKRQKRSFPKIPQQNPGQSRSAKSASEIFIRKKIAQHVSPSVGSA